MLMVIEMIPGAVHGSPGICLTTEENPGKSQLGDVDEGCATSHHLKWGPYFQMTSIGSHSTSGAEKEGKKERTGWDAV